MLVIQETKTKRYLKRFALFQNTEDGYNTSLLITEMIFEAVKFKSKANAKKICSVLKSIFNMKFVVMDIEEIDGSNWFMNECDKFKDKKAIILTDDEIARIKDFIAFKKDFWEEYDKVSIDTDITSLWLEFSSINYCTCLEVNTSTLASFVQFLVNEKGEKVWKKD